MRAVPWVEEVGCGEEEGFLTAFEMTGLERYAGLLEVTHEGGGGAGGFFDFG